MTIKQSQDMDSSSILGPVYPFQLQRQGGGRGRGESVEERLGQEVKFLRP